MDNFTKMEQLETNYRIAKDSIRVLDTELTQSKARIAELENPWVNVNEELPPRSKDDRSHDSQMVFIWGGGFYTSPGFYNFNKRQWYIMGNKSTYIPGITHWAPLYKPPNALSEKSDKAE